MWEAISIALSLAGLVLTAVGAYVTAKVVFITDDEANRLAGTYWNNKPALVEILKTQSRNAKIGLSIVIGGMVVQIIAIVLAVAVGAIITLLTSLS